MSIPKFTLRLAILPLLGTLVTAKALDYAVAQTEKSIVFDYAQITPPPETAAKPEIDTKSDALPSPKATPEPTPSQKVASEAPPNTIGVEAPLPSGVDAASTPTGNVTINLINKLVKRGILDADEAKEMIRQAEAEAEAVRSQSQTDMVAIAQAAAVQVVAATAPVESGLPAASSDDIRVTHIPQPVKDQMKEEIKLELATDKVSNQLSSAVRLPKWVQDVKPFLDIRVRYEGDFFPTGNDNTGAFPNFNAINTGASFDSTGTQFAPQLNVDQNRNQFNFS